MPSTKPRISVVLEQADYDAIVRLAKLQGRPAAAVARDFLAQCTPIFGQIAASLEEAQKLTEAAPKELVERLEKAHQAAAPVLAQLLSTLSEVEHLRGT